MSPKGVAMLKGIEELRLFPYDDQTGMTIPTHAGWVKGATIGYGHLISQAEWPKYRGGITEAQADALFLLDLAPFEIAVSDSITKTLLGYEFDALVIFAFNIGVGGFRQSTVRKILNGQSSKPLEPAWKAWKKSQGKVNQGLINRRNAEWRIFTKGIYERW
jgi:GH24 family phage-related lysozyme (muramidase)